MDFLYFIIEICLVVDNSTYSVMIWLQGMSGMTLNTSLIG